MSRHNGLPGYDRYKTRSDRADAPQDEERERPVFTETEVAALVEEMRATCEAIARDKEAGWVAGSNGRIASKFIADDIAALRRPA